MRPLLALLLASALALAAPAARAQGFGKNKVQYEALHWAVLATPHVRLHFYAEEESLARRVAVMAESVCVEYDGRFRLSPREKVPLLLYSTHQLFQQTNATPELLTEATGGLTELIKGRVLIPHNGSWARMRWVTRHELTHWYMLSKLVATARAHRRSGHLMPPLWFIEGLAEYCGTTWDADAEGLLRDAVTTGEALPLTQSDAITGTVLMYKEGQSFLLWLAGRFGPGRVFDLLEDSWRAEDFETLWRMTFGEPLERSDRAWFDELRRRYYPAIVRALPVDQTAAVRVTRRGHYNLGPCVLPNPDRADTSLRFCYFAASENGIDLMRSAVVDGKRRERRLLRGGLSPQFESFHLFQNRPSATPEGLIALSSKRGGRDAVYVVDAARGRVLRRFDFPSLVAITDPSLVPGDTAIVFTGQDYGGRTDLYRVRWQGRRVSLDRLTRDDGDDLEPDVSHDGRWVVFSSDRGLPSGRHALWRLSLETGALEPYPAPARGEDRQPRWSADGRWIAFRSTRGGTSDLYVRDGDPAGTVRRATRLLGPASDPDWLPGSRGLLFTGESGIEFQSYALAFDPDTLPPDSSSEGRPLALAARPVTRGALADGIGEGPATAPDPPREPAPAARDSAPAARDSASGAIQGLAPVVPDVGPPPAPVYDTLRAERYRRHLGLDMVQTMGGVDPALGGGGGAGQVALSDVLGDEQYYLFLSNETAEQFGSFWDGLEVGLTYINQSRRLNYGAGVFRLATTYDPDLNAIRLERRVGLSLIARYPFDKFNRIESSLLVRRALGHLLRDGQVVNADLVSNFIGFVHDNATWTWVGPANGTRLLLTAGYTRDLGSGAGDFGTLLGEVRRYFMPLPQFVSATRLQGQASLGADAQRFYLGGRMALPGYDYHALAGLRTVMAQQELRFPLLRGLRIAFPIHTELPPINGVAFAANGWAWGGGDLALYGVPAWYLTTTDLGPGLRGHAGSAGFGFYLGGGPYPVLRWNYAWQTQNWRTFTRRPRFQFMLGYNF